MAPDVASFDRAIDDPQTRAALRRYRLRCLRAAGLGFVGLVVATTVIGAAENGEPTGVGEIIALIGISWGGLAFLVGWLTLLRTTRMRWVLGRSPWIERPARYRIAPFGRNGQPALLLMADEHRPEAVCSISATVWRYRQLPEGDDPVLVAGDPRWAVIAPLDQRILLVAKRPVLPWWRRKLHKWATTG